MKKTINQIKVAQARAYIAQYGDTQAARSAADQNGDQIDSQQWREASKQSKTK
jgi:hypothetical protein